jgi:hypothetical protein
VDRLIQEKHSAALPVNAKQENAEARWNLRRHARHSRSKNGVASLAPSRSKNGVASLAPSRSKNGVASLAYGGGHPVRRSSSD